MDHRQARQLLSAYLDDELDPAEKAGVEGHLAVCEGCQEALKEIRLTVEALHEMTPKEAPASLAGRIMASVREEETKRRSRWFQIFSLPFLKPVMSTAVVALIAVLVWQVTQQTERQTPTPETALTAPEKHPAPLDLAVNDRPVTMAHEDEKEGAPKRQKTKETALAPLSAPSAQPSEERGTGLVDVTTVISLWPSDSKTTCEEMRRSLNKKGIKVKILGQTVGRCRLQLLSDTTDLSNVMKELSHFGRAEVEAPSE